MRHILERRHPVWVLGMQFIDTGLVVLAHHLEVYGAHLAVFLARLFEAVQGTQLGGVGGQVGAGFFEQGQVLRNLLIALAGVALLEQLAGALVKGTAGDIGVLGQPGCAITTALAFAVFAELIYYLLVGLQIDDAHRPQPGV